MPAPAAAHNKIEGLVAKFKALLPPRPMLYNEVDTRKDFVLPLSHATRIDDAPSTVQSKNYRLFHNC